MNEDVANVVRRCEEWVAGMQKRSVASACIHRHLLAMLAELRERGCSLEDIQVCLDGAVRPVIEFKPGGES